MIALVLTNLPAQVCFDQDAVEQFRVVGAFDGQCDEHLIEFDFIAGETVVVVEERNTESFLDRGQGISKRRVVDLERGALFIGMTVVLFVIDPWLALAALLPMPLLAVRLQRSSRDLRRVTRKQRRREGDAAAFALESLRQVRVVKAYGRESARAADFARGDCWWSSKAARRPAIARALRRLRSFECIALRPKTTLQIPSATPPSHASADRPIGVSTSSVTVMAETAAVMCPQARAMQ